MVFRSNHFLVDDPDGYDYTGFETLEMIHPWVDFVASNNGDFSSWDWNEYLNVGYAESGYILTSLGGESPGAIFFWAIHTPEVGDEDHDYIGKDVSPLKVASDLRDLLFNRLFEPERESPDQIRFWERSQSWPLLSF